MLLEYKGKFPIVASTAKIFTNAVISGDVTLKDNVNVWFNVSMRGDMAPIVVGENTNIQDNAVVHTNTGKPTYIGKNVTVGHGAIIHACTIEDDCLIGMGSIILDGAIVRKGALVGAGAVVPPNKEVPEYTLVVGNPLKFIRTLTKEEISANKKNINDYIDLKNDY